ncbi:hypothetical protein Leryth_005092, partial [Lithospermum erythrorhizon]
DEHVRFRFAISLLEFSLCAERFSYIIPLVIELLGSPVSDQSPSIHEVSSYCLKCIACEGDGRLAAAIGQSDLLNSNPDNSSRQHLLENFSYLSLLREVRRKVYRDDAPIGFLMSHSCGSMISRTATAQTNWFL